MSYVFYNLESKGRGKVNLIHNAPEQLSTEELAKGLQVETMPPKPTKVPVGTNVVLYINPETKEMWYEFESRPLNQYEQIQEIQQKLELTQKALDELLLGGM